MARATFRNPAGGRAARAAVSAVLSLALAWGLPSRADDAAKTPDASKSATPAEPSKDAAAAEAEAAAQAPPPVPEQPAPPAPNLARDLADLDVGGIRETWSATPSFIGDGCAPSATNASVSVGRLAVIATNLESSANGTLYGVYAADIARIDDPALGSVQAIQAAGYPGFVLPAQVIGTVPGTPPVELQAGTPAGGITPVGSPSSFTAAVDNAFATDPAAGTTQFADQSPTTVYDAASSGALVGTVGQDAFLFYNYVIKIDTPALTPGINVGFQKLVENVSPIPRDRVYFNYSYFHNANISSSRADINRFVPGIEKTFFEGWTSIELRTPFAGTLSNVQQVNAGDCGGVSEYRDVEFGNMSVVFKSFLAQRETWGISAGTQVLLPTAQSTFVNAATTTGQPVQLVYVENQSVHMMPFVGAVWAPSRRWFNQFMLQMDVDTNGNPAYVNPLLQPNIRGTQLTSAGRLYYPTFMYTSFATGYWIYSGRGSGLTGVSPVMEVHVNQGMTAFQPLNTFGYSLGNDAGIVSVTNGLVGCNFEWNNRSIATFAYVTPLGGGADRFFDGEFRAFINYFYGPRNRVTRAQF